MLNSNLDINSIVTCSTGKASGKVLSACNGVPVIQLETNYQMVSSFKRLRRSEYSSNTNYTVNECYQVVAAMLMYDTFIN